MKPQQIPVQVRQALRDAMHRSTEIARMSHRQMPPQHQPLNQPTEHRPERTGQPTPSLRELMLQR